MILNLCLKDQTLRGNLISADIEHFSRYFLLDATKQDKAFKETTEEAVKELGIDDIIKGYFTGFHPLLVMQQGEEVTYGKEIVLLDEKGNDRLVTEKDKYEKLSKYEQDYVWRKRVDLNDKLTIKKFLKWVEVSKFGVAYSREYLKEVKKQDGDRLLSHFLDELATDKFYEAAKTKPEPKNPNEERLVIPEIPNSNRNEYEKDFLKLCDVWFFPNRKKKFPNFKIYDIETDQIVAFFNTRLDAEEKKEATK